MTREDAIKTLKELWRETNDPWYEEVYNMAIDALNAGRITQTEPQTEYNKDLKLFADILFDKNKSNQFLEECKTIDIEP